MPRGDPECFDPGCMDAKGTAPIRPSFVGDMGFAATQFFPAPRIISMNSWKSMTPSPLPSISFINSAMA